MTPRNDRIHELAETLLLAEEAEKLLRSIWEFNRPDGHFRTWLTLIVANDREKHPDQRTWLASEQLLLDLQKHFGEDETR